MSDKVHWDAALYERFAAQRERPFHDLLARVPDASVRAAADLGCGTGRLTRSLLERWPAATLYGVDSSVDMLARAASDGVHPRLHFVTHDLATWEPPQPLDCIVSNAALHWLPGHSVLLPRLAARLARGGVLAVQVPNNRAELPHRAVDELLAESPWRARMPAGAMAPKLEAPAWYAYTLQALGFEVDLWETIYYHTLPSTQAIVEWLQGTTLRPLLTALDAGEGSALLQALSARLEEHYEPGPAGVVFPFRRLFFVARTEKRA